MKTKLTKPIRITLLAVGLVGGGALEIGLVYLLWPGPDTLVVNDTKRQITLTECGDAASQIPPGDVETLNPGDRVTIPSGKFEQSNVCDVYFGDDSSPGACLPLPLKQQETIYVSRWLKPYPIRNLQNYQPCDLLAGS